MRYIFLCLMVLSMMPSCSLKSEPVISNDYVTKVKDLTAHGLDALHQGRLASSQQSLEQALNAAWLSADFVWVGLAQYHLGALYMTQGKTKQAVVLFQRAKKHALVSQDQRTLWRCIYALALYQEQSGETGLVGLLPALNQNMPADVYISAGRLAQLQQHPSKSKAAYQHVLSLPPINKGRMYEHAQASLGLALLEKELGNQNAAKSYSDKVIQLSQQAGFPMLAAHAYLLQGKIFGEESSLNKALNMYQALGDKFGQLDSLATLIVLAQEQGNQAALNRWQQLKLNLD